MHVLATGAGIWRNHVKFSLMKLGATAGLLGLFAAPIIGLTAAQAGAIPPVAHPNQDLESAGSDTIYWATAAIDHLYNLNTCSSTCINTDKDFAGAIPPVNFSPFPASYTTKGDGNCAAMTYDSSDAAHTPPNGSSAGITALVNDGSTGCIDYARSSRGRKSGDVANIDFWAFGLDALSVGRFVKNSTTNPATGYAPPNLTQQQIIDIYTCDPATGAPFISDWHTLNSHAPVGSTIQKFAPQTSSGTYSFFNSKILNGATIDANCNSSHLSTFIEEHDAAQIPSASKPYAIFPMSYSQWKAMSAHKIPDLRNGITEMKINGVAPGPKTVNESSTRFLGTRYVYNVTSPVEPDYTDVLRLVGADNGGPGFICGGKAKSTIIAYGIVPLPSAATGTTSSGTNVTLATFCRVNPTPL